MHKLSQKRSSGISLLAAFLLLLPVISVADDSAARDAALREIGSGSNQVRRDAATKLGHLGAASNVVSALAKAIDDQDRQVSTNALDSLAELGPDAREAIPALVDALDSRKVRGARNQGRQQSAMRAAYALSRIGPDAIPPLIKALSGEDTPLRQGAAQALGKMGSAAHDAIPALIGNLGAKDSELQNAVIGALIEFGPASVRPVADCLGSPDAQVRQTAVRTLSGLGKLASATAARLLDLARSDPDTAVRAAAYPALIRIGASREAAVPLLVEALRAPDEMVRHAASNALAQVRPLAPAVSALQAALNDPDPKMRDRAAHVLSLMGAEAAPAGPALLACAKAAPDDAEFTDAISQIGEAMLPLLLKELSSGADPTREEWVFRTLRNMGAAAKPALLAGLTSPQAPIRAAAAQALADLPIDSPATIQALSGLLADTDPSVRASALRSLATVRTQRESMRPKLEAALDDAAPEVRKAAAAGLASMGAVEKIAVPGLIDLLSDKDAGTQLAAMRALGDRAAGAEAAVPLLTADLDKPALQSAAAETLGKIGAPSEPAAGRLLELARGKDREVKIAALSALSGIGRPADQIGPVAYEALKSDDREIRLAALQVVAKVEQDEAKLLPILLKALKEESGRVRRVAAIGLRGLGEKASAAVPELIPMLDRDLERQTAIDTLKAIHVRDLPSLLTVLNNKDPKVRAFACESLGDLGAGAREAVPVLEAKAQNDSEPVRDAAKKALDRIKG